MRLFWSRAFRLALAAMLLWSRFSPPAASAESTATEVSHAKEDDKGITQTYDVVSDPLLNAWVDGIAHQLWTQVGRRDVPYRITILDDGTINSFTIGGGYIYVDTGLLDFVQSDDELASVIGHETGHNERRHTVTFQTKQTIASLLFGVAAIFSPALFEFGQILEGGTLAKIQRGQELQADQYGLALMTRTGYDPDAMVSMMNHLGMLENEHQDTIDRYLADHPGVPDRIAHLVGYPALDPTKRTANAVLTQALHDEQEDRYSIAALKLRNFLMKHPDDAIAQLHLARVEIALGQLGKSAQMFSLAAENGDAATKSAALADLSRLQADEGRSSSSPPPYGSLGTNLSEVRTEHLRIATDLSPRVQTGLDRLSIIKQHLQNVADEVPEINRSPARPGTRMETLQKSLAAMGRSIDSAMNKSEEVVQGVGQFKSERMSGLLEDNQEIFRTIEEQSSVNPLPPHAQAVVANAPRVIDDLRTADADLTRSVDSGLSAIDILDAGLNDFEALLKQLRRVPLAGGDLSPEQVRTLEPRVRKAGDSLARAASVAARAEQSFNLARSRQLQSRITLLGLTYPQERFQTLTDALKERFSTPPLDFAAMNRAMLTPGEVAAASIIAADLNTTPQAILSEAKANGKTIVDVADAHGMNALSLEIFLGLIYLNYTDDPQKELLGISYVTFPSPQMRRPS
ncbi:MAG TPA: M48 family metalloprotease [Candidatus Baltobacteraceae bacterium]|jgi:Zn-dependent protease with chaperone function|nr:M48 family metalloprotease [Candidatus Baltobacteraceae bacterium]